MNKMRKLEFEQDLLERPLTARSVVLSLLLGRRPARARAALLVRWCALFGISESAARVALSRMVERGELHTEAGTYELSGPVRRRLAEQERALRPPEESWRGQWHLVVLGATQRTAAERVALREVLRRAHFAERREGVWLRPDNLAVPVDPLLRTHATVWRAAPVEDDPGTLASELFLIHPMAERGRWLADRLTAVTDSLGPQGLAEAFVIGAAALQHLRRDPLLPGALLPGDWPGERLRSAYRNYEARFSAAVADWYRRV